MEVKSVAGAGDGVPAGIALAISRGEPPEYGLWHGFVLAAATLEDLATADFAVEEYERLLAGVRVEATESGAGCVSL